MIDAQEALVVHQILSAGQPGLAHTPYGTFSVYHVERPNLDFFTAQVNGHKYVTQNLRKVESENTQWVLEDVERRRITWITQGRGTYIGVIKSWVDPNGDVSHCVTDFTQRRFGRDSA